MTRALTRLPQAPRRGTAFRATGRLTRTMIAVAISIAFVASGAPTSFANDEADRDAVDVQIAQSNQRIAELEQRVSTARQVADDAAVKVTSAQDSLAQAIAARETAKKEDAEAQASLAKAQQQLTAAQADVKTGRARVAEQTKRNGGIARSVYSGSQNPLVGFAVISQATSLSDLQDRLKWTDQVMAAQGNKLHDLHAAQVELEAAEQRMARAEADAQAARAAAAKALSDRSAAEAQAQTKAAELKQAQAEAVAAKNNAETAVSDAQGVLAQQQAEKQAIEARIQERIRLEELERQRQEQLRLEAEARARAEAEARARAEITPQPAIPAPETAIPTPVYSSSGLTWPTSGVLTSGYGGRVDPVTGSYTMFHEGQDIANGCGTPLVAAADGVVGERFYNSSLGNYLVIDHGKIGGAYLSTGYGHATGFIVGVGDRVAQGQVIGYMGTTGWSTGCHLHYNVYENGRTVDPMKYL